MKRALAFALAGLGFGYVFDNTRVGCFIRGQHDPRRARTPLGGWRCARCQMAGASLDDFGSVHLGSGYASLIRPQYSRNHGGEIERSESRQ
jgi:hypothetical protein